MADDPVTAAFRTQHGRAVAVLTRLLGDLDLAEEAVAEAFTAAVATWPTRGVPPEPAGWIITTARRRAIDQLRRDAVGRTKLAEVARLQTHSEPEEVGAVRDDQLRLLFTCCDPALGPATRVALTLRMVGGLSTTEIARAFLVPEPTMAQRISRGKAKIRAARIPYRIPTEADLPDRLRSVLAVVYLVLAESHTATAGSVLGRVELGADAVRLARVLHELLPDEPEVTGLLALALLTESRRPARVVDGAAVPLAQQDRTRWDPALVAEGQGLVRECLWRGAAGPYQVQAAIAAVHSDAAKRDRDRLGTGQGAVRPAVRAHPDPGGGAEPCGGRRRARRSVRGTGAARRARARPLTGAARDSPVLHGIRADLLRRLGRTGEACLAYDEAAVRTNNEAEREWLRARRPELSRPG